MIHWNEQNDNMISCDDFVKMNGVWWIDCDGFEKMNEVEIL